MSLVEKGEFPKYITPFFRFTGPGIRILIFKQTGVQCIAFGELGSYPKIQCSCALFTVGLTCVFAWRRAEVNFGVRQVNRLYLYEAKL